MPDGAAEQARQAKSTPHICPWFVPMEDEPGTKEGRRRDELGAREEGRGRIGHERPLRRGMKVT